MVYAPAGLTRVSRQQIGATERTCLYDGVCLSSEVLTEAIAVVGTVAFAVAFLLTLTRLYEAKDVLDAELERTRREREAFETFVERVAGIDPETPRLTDGGRAAVTPSATGNLSNVISAYEEEVMGMDHYETEYDDTLPEHMAAELGDDVALAVTNGGILSPQLQQTLCRTGLQARDRRDRLLSALDAEAASLDRCHRALHDARETLDAVDPDDSRERTALTSDWQTVHAVRKAVDDLLAERQADIHDQRQVVGGGDEPMALYEYVYENLQSNYPVLSIGTNVLWDAKELRKDLSGSLVGR